MPRKPPIDSTAYGTLSLRVTIRSSIVPTLSFASFITEGERSRDHLAAFSGCLHADAFSGYEALYRAQGSKPPRITHAACWAHARRKLFEVFETTKSTIAEEGLQRIGELYAIEDEINGQG